MSPQELDEAIIVVGITGMMGVMAGGLWWVQQRKRRKAEAELDAGEVMVALQSKLRVVVGTLGLLAAVGLLIPLFVAFDPQHEHGLELMLSVGFLSAAGLGVMLGTDMLAGGALELRAGQLIRRWGKEPPQVIDLNAPVEWTLWQTAIQGRPVQVMTLRQGEAEICLNCFDDAAIGPPGPMKGDSMGAKGMALWERLKVHLRSTPAPGDL